VPSPNVISRSASTPPPTTHEELGAVAPAPAVALDAADEPLAVMIDLDEWGPSQRWHIIKVSPTCFSVALGTAKGEVIAHARANSGEIKVIVEDEWLRAL
jgi:hypothetical protein